MSAAKRAALRRAGEALLHEWQVAPDATPTDLAPHIGRDPTSDLAIAARLGSIPETHSATLLQHIEQSAPPKLVQREVRRALYRLQQRGVTLPPAATSPAATSATVASVAAPVEGYLSPIDGRGDQVIWLVKPFPDRLAYLFAVINDPDGVKELNLVDTTRKTFRAGRVEMEKGHGIRMVEADWRYCDALIDRAHQWADTRDASRGDYPRIRAQFTREPVADLSALVAAQIENEAILAAPALLAQSAQALTTGIEFRTWLLDLSVLTPYVEEIESAQSSVLVLSDAQQHERMQTVVQQATADIFGGAHHDGWVRRLEGMAYYFLAAQRTEQGQHVAAAALALRNSTNGGRDIPLCTQLVHSRLMALLEMRKERQQAQEKDSLIVTPQQALRTQQ